MPIRPAASRRAVATLALAGLLAACGGEAEAPRPNIVVYLVDTLRQDHLGVYGYERETSPNIDALAQDSIRFSQAFATSSWTKASTASLLTGLHPRQHGATSRSSSLSEQATLLSEHLGPLGYYRAAVVTNPFVVGHWGFSRGYEVFEDLGEDINDSAGWQRIPAALVNDRALEILDARPGDQPFFLYLHTIDPHGPNIPPKPYDTLFTRNPRPPGNPGTLPNNPSPGVVKNTIALYDSEIRYSDDRIGEFLQGLKDRGLYDNTVIWFVSDHGEEFLDHGRGGHGNQVFNEVIKVPLLLKLPDQEDRGAVVNTPISLIDVLVTQLNLLDLRAPEILYGRNLVELVGATPAPTPVFFDLNLVHGAKRVLHVSRGVVLEQFKYFEEILPEPQRYLFDLSEDPKETTNLFEREPEKVAELETLLQIHRASELSGLVLRGVGGKTGDKFGWTAVLRTDGQFVGVTGIDLEQDDLFEFDPGGQVLTIQMDLQPVRQNVVGRSLLQDVDSVAIRVEPRSARVTIESARIDPSEVMPIYLGLERVRAAAPVEISGDQQSLLCPQLSTMFTEAERSPRGGPTEVPIPPGLYVVRLPDPSADLDIPPDMVERLKAMGYM